MDLDKLKKAALDKTMAFKIFKDNPEKNKHAEEDTSSFGEFAENMKVSMDGAPDGDETMDSTKRFNLRDVLSGLKKIGDELLDTETESDDKPDHDAAPAGADTSENKDDIMTSEETSKADSREDSTAASEQHMQIGPDIISSRLDEIKTGIDELKETSSDDKLSEQSERLDDISRKLSTIKNMLEKQSDNTTKSVVNINAKLNAQDDRLADLITSLGSVSKLNDSVFDLKNSQMNTRNSIDALETSFLKLKRKMTVGITIISVLSAVLIVLEVLNLLS